MSDLFLTEDSNQSHLLSPIALDDLLLKTPTAPEQMAEYGLEMPWEALSAIIQGKSAIDIASMPIHNEAEAKELLYNYGFDCDLPEDRAELEGYFIEAINFIEHRFLTQAIPWTELGEPAALAEKIPLAVSKNRDVIDLLMMASQPDHPHRAWACALLKVIHTLVYIQNSPLYKHHAQASEVILSKFREVLQPQPDGTVILRGGGVRQLNLYAFEAKHHKPRESILIKLLCKKENVAENVWDLVGVRLVTYHAAEAILAVDILRERKVILFPNVIPSRSRNTLLDFSHFKALYQEELLLYKQGLRSVEQMLALFSTEKYQLPEETHANQNPLSAPQYRSLHITCRQLLKESTAQANGGYSRFAFPYEIQVLDKANYLENKVGHGAHANYKRRQLFAARRRVLGSLLQEAIPLPEPLAKD